jgi:uncharacterized membrane protein YgdD (TMEM256/DUF423 family)
MTRVFLSLGSLSAGLAVILGAFGAHALESRLTEEALETYQTGVQYHFLHSLGLIAVGTLHHTAGPSRRISLAGWAMLAGIVLFSGSLYALSLTGIRVLGAITPFGGGLFIASWILLAIATTRREKR